MTTHPQAAIVQSNMILPQWPEYEGQPRDRDVEHAYVCDLTSLGVSDFRIVPVSHDSPPFPLLGLYGAAFLLDPQVVNAIGYMADPGFKAHAEDADLGLRVNAAGYQVLLAPQSVVYHDTEWHFHWNMRNFRRAFQVTQNTILAYYKVCYPSEFVRLLPRLLAGKVIKAQQHCRSLPCRLFYVVLATPIAVIALIAALLKMPSFRHRRQITLKHRTMEPGWLVDRLLNADWKPEPAVWKGVVLPSSDKREEGR
jgi:hypothetical protein